MKQVEYYKNGNRTLRIKYEGIKKLLEKQDKEIERLNNVINGLNDKIEDDKMIIEGNWGCINNLRKDYILQENIIKEVREKINNYTTRMEVLNYQISDLTKKELLEILDKGVDKE